MRNRWMSFLLALALFAPGTARADESDLLELPEMEVTAQSNDDLTIDSDLLKRNLALDMKDVFRNQSSIEIGGGSRAAQRIYVRGIEATNLNVTVDGAGQGMNLFQHRGNIGGISPHLLKSVEVQTMPTADQGAGALGGSIRFVTVDARDLLDAGKTAGFIARGGYSSVDRGDVVGGTAFGRAGKHLGILFDYSKSTFDPYKDGKGHKIVGSEGEDTSLFFKISLLELAGHSLKFSVEQQKDEGLFTGDWDYTSANAQNPTHQVSERETYVFEHRFRSEGNEMIDWKFNSYRNESTLDRGSEINSDGYGIDARNTAKFAVGPTRHALTFGFDWSSEEGKVVGNPTNIDLENMGIYLQNRMTISRLLLSFGARYDDYDTSFGEVDISGNEISPNVGAEIDLGWGFAGFASYGEATRAKGIIPIGWLATVTDDAVVNQVAGKKSYGKKMQPESSKTHEYGVRYAAADRLVAEDRLRAQVSLFETEIDNLIAQVGGMMGAPVTGFYNDDLIITKGYEVKLGWGLRGFDTNLSFTHADAQDKDGNAISFTRRKAASTGDTLVWDSFWNLNPTLGLGYTLKHVSSLNRDDVKRDGYTLHSAQIVLTPTFFNGLTLTVAAHNLLDEQYSSQVSSGSDDSATPEPGRDIRVGIAYKVQF